VWDWTFHLPPAVKGQGNRAPPASSVSRRGPAVKFRVAGIPRPGEQPRRTRAAAGTGGWPGAHFLSRTNPFFLPPARKFRTRTRSASEGPRSRFGLVCADPSCRGNTSSPSSSTRNSTRYFPNRRNSRWATGLGRGAFGSGSRPGGRPPTGRWPFAARAGRSCGRTTANPQ
jgi:hypothetical protein